MIRNQFLSRISKSGLAFAVFIIAQPANANLIMNGSFEEFDIPSNSFQVFQSIPGWTKTFGNGIEIQDNVAGSPYEGDQFVELDAFANSGMEQFINTVAGLTYTLDFAFSARPRVPETSNGIDVLWDGSFLANITADGTGLIDTDWTIQTFLVTATSASTSLEFRATGTSDSLGGYIDSVSLVAATVPEPSIVLLLSSGLILLGIARRKV